jgi:hypothetical protein
MIGLARHPDRSDIRIGNHVRVGGGGYRKIVPQREQIVQRQGIHRRKIRLTENKTKCRYLKKLTRKGTLRQVFICLMSPALLGVSLDCSSSFVGSESGQKQSVKLLQNMVSNTTQHPPTPTRIQDPGSEVFSLLDSGVKKNTGSRIPDPISGSATLLSIILLACNNMMVKTFKTSICC